MMNVMFIGHVLRVRGRLAGDLIIADREDLDNLSTSEVKVKRFTHQDVPHEETHSFPRAGGALRMMGLLRPHHGEKPAEGNFMQDEEDKEDETIFEENSGKDGQNWTSFFLLRQCNEADANEH